jgi:hypothetical protein
LQTLSDENPELNTAILANAPLIQHLVALLVPGVDGQTNRISACTVRVLSIRPHIVLAIQQQPLSLRSLSYQRPLLRYVAPLQALLEFCLPLVLQENQQL